jgi:hypothetical protein
MDDTRKEQQLPVAEVKPGDFPLCSMESRATARAFAESKNRAKRESFHAAQRSDGRSSERRRKK